MPYAATGSEMSAQSQWIADAPVTSPSGTNCQTTYCQVSGTFTVPAGAASVRLMVPLARIGTVKTDDYNSSTGGPPNGLSEGIVSVTIDDGWSSAYTKARAILNTNMIPATFFVVSLFFGDTPDYMTAAQIKTLANENGNEIGNHTTDHSDLTALTDTAARRGAPPMLRPRSRTRSASLRRPAPTRTAPTTRPPPRRAARAMSSRSPSRCSRPADRPTAASATRRTSPPTRRCRGG